MRLTERYSCNEMSFTPSILPHQHRHLNSLIFSRFSVKLLLPPHSTFFRGVRIAVTPPSVQSSGVEGLHSPTTVTRRQPSQELRVSSGNEKENEVRHKTFRRGIPWRDPLYYNDESGWMDDG